MVDSRNHRLPDQSKNAYRMGSPLTALKGIAYQGEVRCQNFNLDFSYSLPKEQGTIYQATVCLLPQATQQECHSCTAVKLRYGDC